MQPASLASLLGLCGSITAACLFYLKYGHLTEQKRQSKLPGHLFILDCSTQFFGHHMAF